MRNQKKLVFPEKVSGDLICQTMKNPHLLTWDAVQDFTSEWKNSEFYIREGDEDLPQETSNFLSDFVCENVIFWWIWPLFNLDIGG